MCGCLAFCISTVTGWYPFRVLLPFAAPTRPFMLCLSVWNVETMWMLQRWRVVFYWLVLKQLLNTICFSCVVMWANQYQYKQEHTRGYSSPWRARAIPKLWCCMMFFLHAEWSVCFFACWFFVFCCFSGGGVAPFNYDFAALQTKIVYFIIFTHTIKAELSETLRF